MRYPTRRPSSANAAASMAMQTPPPKVDQVPGPDLAGAAEGTPSGQGDGGDGERGRLLRRIGEARIPHLNLALLVVEAEGMDGLDSFTDAALRRMAAVLDVVEDRENG